MLTANQFMITLSSFQGDAWRSRILNFHSVLGSLRSAAGTDETLSQTGECVHSFHPQRDSFGMS
jgi:hypothetical protein